MEKDTDNLIKWFPEHKNIDKKVIIEMIDHIDDNCKYCQDIYQYFRDYINECFPCENQRYDSPEVTEYYDYIFEKQKNGKTFNEWITMVEEWFLRIHGDRRTFTEACELAADKWCEFLFKPHIQDNGEKGSLACMYSSVLKNKISGKIDENVIKNVRKNIFDYYRAECMYVNKEYSEKAFQIWPYSDYGPNAPLYDLLKESGIPDDYITNICPWKTGIQIDRRDNAVVLIGYQKREYL